MVTVCPWLEILNLSKLAIGDLVCLWAPPRAGHHDTRASSKSPGLPGLVCDITDSNVYEPAEANVYFGCLEVFEWYPVKTLSLVPDEER